MDQYKIHYDAIMSLPVVKSLLKENRKLKKANRKLAMKAELLEDILYKFMKSDIVDLSADEEPVHIKCEENVSETVIIDDCVEQIDEQNEENIKYQLVDEEAEEDTEGAEAEEETEGAEAEEDTEGAEAEEEAEEEEAEAEEEAEEEEAEAEEEEAEEEAEEEDTEGAEEEEEVFEITIKNKVYYTNNEKNGTIYAVKEDGDIGDPVGNLVEGVPKFNKKK